MQSYLSGIEQTPASINKKGRFAFNEFDTGSNSKKLTFKDTKRDSSSFSVRFKTIVDTQNDTVDNSIKSTVASSDCDSVTTKSHSTPKRKNASKFKKIQSQFKDKESDFESSDDEDSDKDSFDQSEDNDYDENQKNSKNPSFFEFKFKDDSQTYQTNTYWDDEFGYSLEKPQVVDTDQFSKPRRPAKRFDLAVQKQTMQQKEGDLNMNGKFTRYVKKTKIFSDDSSTSPLGTYKHPKDVKFFNGFSDAVQAHKQSHGELVMSSSSEGSSSTSSLGTYKHPEEVKFYNGFSEAVKDFKETNPFKLVTSSQTILF